MASKIFAEDVVQLTRTEQHAFVVRSWTDDLDSPHEPSKLKEGEIEVVHASGQYEIVKASDLKVVNRNVLPGDLVRSSSSGPSSDKGMGVVFNTHSQVLISPVFRTLDQSSEDPLPQVWVESSQVTSATRFLRGDYVVYGGWIGAVEEVVDEAVVEVEEGLSANAPPPGSGSGGLRRAPRRRGTGGTGGGISGAADASGGEGGYAPSSPSRDRRGPSTTDSPASGVRHVMTVCDVMGGMMAIGQQPEPREYQDELYAVSMSGHPVPTDWSSLLTGAFHTLRHFDQSGRNIRQVLDVKQTVVCVNWLAISQKFSPQEQTVHPRPKRFWAGREIEELCIARTDVDGYMVGNRVVLSDPRDGHRLGLVPATSENLIPNANHSIMQVVSTKSTVSVVWPDGSRSVNIDTLDIEHCRHSDDEEHDVWPGDVAVWRGGGEAKRVAIVQKVDTKRRTVEVQWYDSKVHDVVSILELDPHGSSTSSYGVRRGDLVLIADKAVDSDFPVVPRLGESENMPSEELLRVEMAKRGLAYTGANPRAPPCLPRSGAAIEDIDWFGEVHDINLDGSVVVQIPSGRMISVPLQHLSVFASPLESELLGGGEADEGMDDYIMEMDDGSDDGMSESSWVTEGDVVDEWGAADGAEEDEVTDIVMSGHDGEGDQTTDITTPNPGLSAAASAISLANGVEQPERRPEDDDPNWKRFQILEEAPADHHFIEESQQAPSKPFLNRLRKEYQALETSLPETILVRAYEDRSDLLRCLIIGPPGTPYQDAPFLVDFFLPPSKYPSEPPKAFFHSWTNGAGRCNPNLYQEGKICLSILNTWTGDKTESWNPARSSVFQALVSIQGLVLVREPWFLEPGYEAQRGTTGATVASGLYSERTYVLTRGFIAHGLSYAVPSFAAELAWLYHSGGRLVKVIEEARALIGESETFNDRPAASGDEDPAAAAKQATNSISDKDAPLSGLLTPGGIIPLKRTLIQLEALASAQTNSSQAQE